MNVHKSPPQGPCVSRAYFPIASLRPWLTLRAHLGGPGLSVEALGTAAPRALVRFAGTLSSQRLRDGLNEPLILWSVVLLSDDVVEVS